MKKLFIVSIAALLVAATLITVKNVDAANSAAVAVIAGTNTCTVDDIAFDVTDINDEYLYIMNTTSCCSSN